MCGHSSREDCTEVRDAPLLSPARRRTLSQQTATPYNHFSADSDDSFFPRPSDSRLIDPSASSDLRSTSLKSSHPQLGPTFIPRAVAHRGASDSLTQARALAARVSMHL